MSRKPVTNLFVKVPNWLLDSGVSSGAITLWCWLKRYAGPKKTCRPFQKTLASKMNRTRASVQRYEAELVKVGALKVHQRPNTSSIYTPLLRPASEAEVGPPVMSGNDTSEAATPYSEGDGPLSEMAASADAERVADATRPGARAPKGSRAAENGHPHKKVPKLEKGVFGRKP